MIRRWLILQMACLPPLRNLAWMWLTEDERDRLGAFAEETLVRAGYAREVMEIIRLVDEAHDEHDDPKQADAAASRACKAMWRKRLAKVSKAQKAA